MSFYFDMSIEQLQEAVQENPFEIELWLALINRVAKEDSVENALDEVFVAEDFFPENFELQAVKSLCLMSLGETRAAHELLQQTLRRSPGDEIVNRIVADFLPNFKGISQDRLLNPYDIRDRVRMERCESDFLERLDSTIDLIRAFNDNQSQPHRLVRPLERHVRNFPGDINARLDLARLCHNIGEHEKARGHYRIVLEDDPLCASAYFELATIELDEDIAIELSEQGLDLCPRFEGGRFNYASLLLKKGMLDAGRNEMMRIPADSPLYVLGLEAIANSHGQEGSYMEALKAQEKVVALSADNPEAWNCYGHFFAQLGDFEAALQHFDRVIQIDIEHLDGLHNRALMLGQLGRHEDAIHVLKYALTIDPANESLLVNLAIELNHAGHTSEAIKLTEDSLNRFPNQPRMWLNLGSLWLQTGRLEDSIECSQMAVEIDPDREIAWWNLALAHAKLGNRNECLRSLRMCLDLSPELMEQIWTEDSLQPFLDERSLEQIVD